MSRAARIAYRTAARASSGDRLAWDRDGADWPNRAHSSFIRVAGLDWHIQRMGQGPALLLIHGSGASTHSWRALAPLLARHFTVLAPDLPGHGFTGMPDPERLSLPGVAASLTALLKALGVRPDFAVGHSAGAAILARMCLDGAIAPAALVSLNGAFLPLRGIPVHLFSPLTRLLMTIPMMPRLVARQAANSGVVARLLNDTGSRLEPAGVAQYQRLFSNPGHIAGALTMMASWRLEPLAQQLGRLKPAVLLLVGDKDGTISPGEAIRVRALVPGATIARLPGLGHLAHEEAPEKVAELITQFAEACGKPRLQTVSNAD